MPGHWLHNLDPVAIHIHGQIGIRWYGLAYLAGLAWGWWMLGRWVNQGRSPIRFEKIGDFVLYVGIGMIVGGRLGYCLIYGRDHLFADPLYLIKLWEGGMASHGGILGMVAGAWWYARQERLATPVLLDLVASGAPMGIFLGRLANFVNGELWGKPGDVPWAVIFRDAPLVGGINVPRHPSQLYEAALEGLFLLLLILPLHARHRRPGLSAGVLLGAYAVARFIGEFWREPDFGHPPYFGWMNKGQALSIPVLLIGLIIAIWAWRRGVRKADYLPPAQPTAPATPPINLG